MSRNDAMRRAFAHRLVPLLSVWLVWSCGRVHYDVTADAGAPADTEAPADTGTAGSPDLSSWRYRKRITVEASRVAADLDGFPLLVVRASDSDLAGRAQETGQDILFTRAGSTTRLRHEIESFDPGSGALVAWVRVDRLSATTDTELDMYYGNPEASAQEDPEGVWTEYSGVWHLNDDPGSSPEIRDATANRNHGTAMGLDASSRLAGPIGGALHFESADVVDLSDPANGTLDTGTSSFSVSLWVRVTASGDCLFAFRKSADEFVTAGYDLRLGLNSWEARCSDGNGVDGIRDPNFGTESEFLGRWSWLVGIVDREVAVFHAYANGVSRQSSEIVTIGSLSNDEPATIGASCLGDLDEARVAAFALSPEWIATEYANQSDPTGFVTFGEEEAL